MANAFRMTKDGSLDRQYLRVSAVYRCAARYGMSKHDAIERLSERMSRSDATKLTSIWGQSHKLRDSATYHGASA